MNERGRVPFALVGVLLLATSAAVAPGLQARPAADEPAVDAAMERLRAESLTALRSGVAAAARAAAANPVTEPAGTRFGRVVDGSTPFRDALRIRIYLQVRERLRALGGRRRGLATTASIPGIDAPGSLRAAKRRVNLERTGPNGSALVVTVRNLSLRASHNGAVRGRERLAPTVVVDTPVLAVHDRVARYEGLLSNGPTRPGLGRRLTGALYPVVWARGYAQYRGTPIQNVLANRHLALLTNGAVLDLQRDVFGDSDPVGRRVLARAAAGTAVTDLLAGTPGEAVHLLEQARARPDAPGPDAAGRHPLARPEGSGPSPAETVRIAVDATADRAYLGTRETLPTLANRSHTVEVRRTATVTSVRGGPPDPPPRPGPGWTLADRAREERVLAVDPAEAAVGAGADATDWHGLAAIARTVRIEHVRRRTWRRGGRRRTTVATASEVRRVTLDIQGNHTARTAPDRPVRRVHRVGGPLDGPNLAGVRETAVDRLVRDRGGAGALARRAVHGTLPAETLTLRGARPAGLTRWLAADLIRLRTRVANLSVRTTRGRLATFRARPARRLADRVASRRADLAAVPTGYGSLAHRARVGARLAFLDRVEARLRTRAREASGRAPAEAMGPASLRTLRAGYRTRHRTVTPSAPGLPMRVDAAPAYLTRDGVTHEVVPAVPAGRPTHPLVTANTNHFSVPYADAADALVAALFGPERVRLRTAAATLRSATRAGLASTDARERRRLRRLRRAVADGVSVLEGALSEHLAAAGLGTDRSRRAVLRRALGRWNDTAARALALTNGSGADRVVAVASRRWPDAVGGRVQRDRLTLELDALLRRVRTSDAVRPPQPLVNRTAGAVAATVRRELSHRLAAGAGEAVRRGLGRVSGRAMARLPSGLPVAPVPGAWYATVNTWHVEVAGAYTRFTVRVPRGAPTAPAGSLAYVRDGSAVALDVDGDGGRERLGRGTRVDFRVETSVGIAVPPGLPGVGDVDGQSRETSAGWPSAGPE